MSGISFRQQQNSPEDLPLAVHSSSLYRTVLYRIRSMGDRRYLQRTDGNPEPDRTALLKRSRCGRDTELSEKNESDKSEITKTVS